MLVNKDIFLQKRAFRYQDVTIENFGTVRVRELSGTDKNTFDNSITTIITKPGNSKPDIKVDTKNYNMKLLALCICDEEGNPLFSYDEFNEIGKNLSGTELAILVDAALTINGIKNDEIAEVEKNSDATQTEDSISVSA